MQAQIRDPVHNFIRLGEEEVRLVGTRALQRLRGIRQLAMASLVYPGALHTRFDHTLGVTHVAGLMASALGLDADESRLVRLAALLHDIGHGPFSHVSEHALDRYGDRTKAKSAGKTEKIHELVTAGLICGEKEIVSILGKEMCGRVVKLLNEGHGQRALKSIVSGPLDADKQDYLLRDSLFCGVQYGVFDIPQLHRSLALVGPENEKDLMIRRSGIHAVEQYALAKYYLTTNVYRQKVRLITDQMIVRAIALGIERDGVKKLRELYTFDGTTRFLENYVQWDDARFMQEFCVAARKGKCRDLLERLRTRHLFKQVFSARTSRFPPESREAISELSAPQSAPRRAGIENAAAAIIAGVCGQKVDPDFVIVHAYNIKSVRSTARNDESGILVCGDGNPVPFEDESMLFRSIDERYNDQFVEVYAPVTWDSATNKKLVQRELEEPLFAMIAQHCTVPQAEGKP